MRIDAADLVCSAWYSSAHSGKREKLRAAVREHHDTLIAGTTNACVGNRPQKSFFTPDRDDRQNLDPFI